MKPFFVHIVLLLSVIAAIFLFNIKSKETNKFDKVKTSLSAIENYTSKHPRLGMICRGADPEIPPFIIYLLAPSQLLYTDTPRSDTTFIIAPKDHEILTTIRQSNVLWQNADSEYKYALITRN